MLLGYWRRQCASLPASRVQMIKICYKLNIYSRNLASTSSSMYLRKKIIYNILILPILIKSCFKSLNITDRRLSYTIKGGLNQPHLNRHYKQKKTKTVSIIWCKNRENRSSRSRDSFAQIRPKQVALLWQRDRATRLSVEMLQLQNIPFEN